MLCLLAGRLPDYGEDEEGKRRTVRARWMFYGLLVYHLGLGIIRFLSQTMTNKFKIYQSLLILASVYVMAHIGHDWVYRADRDFSTMDKEQEAFERFMDLEMLIVYVSIFSAMFYTFIRAF